MSFVGNRNGPKKSDVVRYLGAKYFGISEQELEVEIQVFKDEEFFSEKVDPLFEDEQGKYYLLFKAPGGGTQRFYLEKHGFHLSGEVQKMKDR